jgi:hypothetical protein
MHDVPQIPAAQVNPPHDLLAWTQAPFPSQFPPLLSEPESKQPVLAPHESVAGCTWQADPSAVHRFGPHSEESLQDTQQTKVPTAVRMQLLLAQSAADVQDTPNFFRIPQVVLDPQTVESGQPEGVPLTVQLPVPSQLMGVNIAFWHKEPQPVPRGAIWHWPVPSQVPLRPQIVLSAGQALCGSVPFVTGLHCPVE